MSTIFCQVVCLYCYAPVLEKRKFYEFKAFKQDNTFKSCKYINGNHTEDKLTASKNNCQ